mgnify:CR=1 FL=1
MASSVLQILRNLSLTEPATEESIWASELAFRRSFPLQYRQFLLLSNGAEGPVGRSSYLVLWPVEQLVPLNVSYETEKYAPGLLIIGSDGGGEAYGFDTRKEVLSVVQTPFVGMSWDVARQLAGSFNEFIELLHKSQ